MSSGKSLALELGVNPKRAYCRSHSTKRTELEEYFKAAYDKKSKKNRCCIFPSGMAAITAVIQCIAMDHHVNHKKNAILVVGNELYCDVTRSLKYIAKMIGGLTTKSVDVRSSDEILSYFKQHGDNIAMFYVEACTNPSGQMFDWSYLPHLRRLAPNCVFVVDNTWLTSVSFNPFSVGADIVLESLSKYNSNGRCIGGMVVGNKKFLSSIQTWVSVYGQFVGADHCELFLDAALSLPARVVAAGELGMALATYLETREGVTVLHPGLASHPTADIFARYVGGKFPGCFWFHVKSGCSLKDMLEAVETAKLPLQTSFGAPHSKLDPWPRLGQSTDYTYGKNVQDGDQDSNQGCWIRIAIGHSDISPEADFKDRLDYLKDRIDELIQKLQTY